MRSPRCRATRSTLDPGVLATTIRSGLVAFDQVIVAVLTNAKKNIVGLEGFGLRIVGTRRIE